MGRSDLPFRAKLAMARAPASCSWWLFDGIQDRTLWKTLPFPPSNSFCMDSSAQRSKPLYQRSDPRADGNQHLSRCVTLDRFSNKGSRWYNSGSTVYFNNTRVNKIKINNKQIHNEAFKKLFCWCSYSGCPNQIWFGLQSNLVIWFWVFVHAESWSDTFKTHKKINKWKKEIKQIYKPFFI